MPPLFGSALYTPGPIFFEPHAAYLVSLLNGITARKACRPTYSPRLGRGAERAQPSVGCWPNSATPGIPKLQEHRPSFAVSCRIDRAGPNSTPGGV